MPLAAFASDDVDGVRRQVPGHLIRGLSQDHATRASQLLGIRLIRLLAAQIKAGISWQSQAARPSGSTCPCRPAAAATP